MSELSLEELLREKELREEWGRCAPDWDSSTDEEKLDAFLYFCRSYVYIRHPEKGKMLFDLREAQVDTAREWISERFTLALKARQIGFSTLVSVYCLWLTFFYDDRTVIMVSKGEREAIKLLAHAKYAYRFMPRWMRDRGPIANISQTKIEMTNDSIIESSPSAADPARGSTAFTIVVDELGQLPNSEDAWASIEPVATVGGRIIMLGTANGEGNLFHKLWVDAKGWWRDRDGTIHHEGRGKNRFRSIFHGWWTAGRDDDWYEAQKADMFDWVLAQEYPSNPDEAFLRSGRPVFNVDALRAMPTEEPIAEGYLDIWNGGGEFVEDGGALSVWRFPAEHRVYCIGADVAEGLEHGDYSSAHVIDARSGLVVANWHGHIDADLFGTEILAPLGRWFNNALIGVESNNHGLTTLKAIVRDRYRNVYKQRRLDKKANTPTESLGWRTTRATKPYAIDELAKALRDGGITLPDSETLTELRQFVREGSGQMHGSPHDDRVMSLAIAVQMLSYVFLPEYQITEEPGPGTMGYFMKRMYSDMDDEELSHGAIGSQAVRSAA